MKRNVFYEEHRVVITPIEDEQERPLHFMRDYSITELLAFMANLPLQDQVYMICNLLTISGYTQSEISEALGVKHQTYRNRLWEIRKDFIDKGINSL